MKKMETRGGMGETFLEKLGKEILVMSGAMSTNLARQGANLGGCVSQWIVDHPETYQKLVQDYYRVGCDIVSGATFTLNPISLEKFGLVEKMEELNRGVIQIIREVRPEGKFVAGNMGPTGKMLKPLGDLDAEDLREAYGRQAQALAQGGAEVINIITMYDLEETVAALNAAKSWTGLPVIVSMAFNPAAKGYRTMMGVSPEQAAARLEAEGADVIGINCGGVDLDQTTEVLRLMRAHCRKPLISKPNAGLPKVADGRELYELTPDHFAARVTDWIDAGARIVSACCGSTPLHLEKIVEKVKEVRRSTGGLAREP